MSSRSVVRKSHAMSLSARALLLKLSENTQVKTLLTRSGMSQGMVRRFVAGETLPEALAAARALQAKRIRTALDLLGENVGSEREASEATDAYVAVLDALGDANLCDGYVSVKLTALGLDQSDALALSNLRRIAEAARAQNNAFVRVDMEGSAYTQRTLEIVQAAHRDYSPLGTVLQSSLRRTDADLQAMIEAGIPIRLVKGAYAEGSDVAYPAKADVDRAYLRQMRVLLGSGTQAVIATHDEAILHDAKRFVREQRIPNSGFEFQMLLGIRRDLQEALAEEGYGMRAYVPFGHTWYPYFMRRLAERPANVGFILKNMVRP